jgi:hypothetical protein
VVQNINALQQFSHHRSCRISARPMPRRASLTCRVARPSLLLLVLCCLVCTSAHGVRRARAPPVPVRRRTQADRAVAFAASPVSSRCPSTFTVSLCFRLSACSSFSYQIGLNRRLDAHPSRAHVLRLPARVGGSEVERESKAGCQGQPAFSITTQNSAMGSSEDKAAAAILALYYCRLKLVDSMP